MYTTISLATYRQATAAAGNESAQRTQVPFPPPPGPHTAYLVFQGDEEGTEQDVDCQGCCEDNRVRKLPFPQDRCLRIMGRERVYFIPVPGQPISSNCYYVVRAEGEYKGLVETCSKEEDMTTSCSCTSIKDISPRPLEPNNPYQQIQIISKGRRFTSECITSDGFPPAFLRRKNKRVEAEDLRGQPGSIAYVRGENASLRELPPPFYFSLSEKISPIVTVGEWYCPFIFIHEKGNSLEDPKNQLMDTPFYKMDLEKFWEEIYRTEVSTAGEDIFVEKTVRVEEALLLGSEAVEEIRDEDGSVWMEGLVQQEGKLKGVRVSRSIIAKMRADQGREVTEAVDRDVRVEKLFKNIPMGTKFVCYVVVERYVLKRMDGSIVLTYMFRHCNQLEGKWA